jgi:hypothetical protein
MDWRKMHTWIMQKYDNIDVDGIWIKLDAIK